MRINKLMPSVLGVLVIVAMASPGCGGGSEGDTTGSDSATSSSGAGTGGQGGEGGAGQGGAGGAGGAGGETAERHGPSASDIVSAGDVSTSPKYKMVFTFGQSTQNQGKTTSPSYRLQGGLTGAIGSAQ